jgi:hypothetical protein
MEKTMFLQSMKKRTHLLIFTALAGFSIITQSNLALSAETGARPFASMLGSWLGDGSVTSSKGVSEHIRCRAKYSASPSGADLHQVLRCASDSYTFDVSADVVYEDGAVSGTWTEANRDATGHVSGRLDGGQVQATIVGPSFSALLVLTTRGDHQSVSIRPKDVDVTAVSINLRRS